MPENGNDTAQTQLQLLDRAYNEARHNAEFTLHARDAKAVMKQVIQLRALAEGMFK